MDMNWQAEQHRDECLRQQQLDEIVRASITRPLTEREQEIIAVEVGLGTIYRKEKKQ